MRRLNCLPRWIRCRAEIEREQLAYKTWLQKEEPAILWKGDTLCVQHLTNRSSKTDMCIYCHRQTNACSTEQEEDANRHRDAMPTLMAGESCQGSCTQRSLGVKAFLYCSRTNTKLYFFCLLKASTLNMKSSVKYRTLKTHDHDNTKPHRVVSNFPFHICILWSQFTH